MTRTGKIVLGLLALAGLVLVAVVVLFLIGWRSVPQGQRDFMMNRDTPEAAEVEAQIASGQASGADSPARIAVSSPSPIQQVVEAGQTVKTPCFEFEVSVKSTAVGDGCRIGVSVWTDSRTREVDYFTVEMLQDDPPGMSLEKSSQSILAGIQAGIARSPNLYRGENPGPYDADFGKYLGQVPASVNGQPAIEMRWGLLPQPGRHVIDPDCPADNATACASTPGLEAYASVKYNMVGGLPAARYTWDGKPLGWLLMTGWAKGHEWKAGQTARESLRLL